MGPSNQPVRIFISYKRHLEPDHHLAAYLYQFLMEQGCAPFIDLTLLPGQSWMEEIDRQIKSSDYMIVLLSEEAAYSEMLQAEVRRAFEYRRQHRRPKILPVRVIFEGLLPYAIDALLDPLQYITWRSQADHQRVGRDILAAIEGGLPRRRPIRTRQVGRENIIAEDGSLIIDEDSLVRPLPACDPRFLETLEAPGGTVKLRDKFYIEREADAQLKRQVVKAGTITSIRASRQKGKSSLLVRGVQHARKHSSEVINLDLQRVDSNYLEDPDRFLRHLAEVIVRKLRLDVTQVDKLWAGSRGPQEKLTHLLEDYVLPENDSTILLAIDEADNLLQTGFHSDFFGMLRSWRNSSAYDEQWEKLNLVLVISTEPYLLISDLHQSPFNIGLTLYLEDFNEAQVHDLNWRHGSPVVDKDFPDMMSLLNGHPYLTRKALYVMVTEKLSWTELRRVATEDDRLFGDHLRRHQWLLRDEPGLKAALRQIVHGQGCPDESFLFRLMRAGLVQKVGHTCLCRCDLYRIYFEDKL
jgi:hypothetical protein